MRRYVELAAPSRTTQVVEEEKRFLFEATSFETTTFKSVQTILSKTSLHEKDLTSERLIWLDLEDNPRASPFHKDIVSSILKYNWYVTWIWDVAAVFHNLTFNSHHQYQLDNQKLNLAIKKIYLDAPVSPFIQNAIDRLLLEHLDIMYWSGVFNKERITDVVMKHASSIRSMSISYEKSNRFRLDIDEKYHKVINADTEVVFGDHKRLKGQIAQKDDLLVQRDKTNAQLRDENVQLKDRSARAEAKLVDCEASLKTVEDRLDKVLKQAGSTPPETHSPLLFGSGRK